MRSLCLSSLAFILKFLNFLLTFVGICIVVYSAWMLDQWNHHIPVSPPLAPPPESAEILSFKAERVPISDASAQVTWDLGVHMVSGFDDSFGLKLSKLPTPWFIYTFMVVGISVCLVTCIGHIAAEAINGCCLCFYSLLTTVLIFLEGAIVAFIAFDHHWKKDLPFDPTGELDSLRFFIEENVDICKWAGITVVSIQALSLLLAFILQAAVSTHRSDDDYEDGRYWEPILNPWPSQSSRSAKVDNKGTYSDMWTSRIREKYGLNSSDAKYNLLNQKQQ